MPLPLPLPLLVPSGQPLSCQRPSRHLRALITAATITGAASAVAVTPVRVPTPPTSRITQVTVHPGAASVERAQRVRGGTRTVTFDCLPEALDPKSVQVDGGTAVRLGELSVRTTPRALSPQCGVHPLDARIRALEEQRDAAQAESEALDLVTGYLKGLGAGPGDGPARGAASARQIGDVAGTVRRTAQDALQQQRVLARRMADIDRQRVPLVDERTSAGTGRARVTTVSVTLDADADADVRLRYVVPGPAWTPVYRAALDASARRVRIERQALVAQATGEDWQGVRLTLSTGQPRRGVAGRSPMPWRIGVAAPPQEVNDRPVVAAAPAPASAQMALARDMKARASPFGVSIVEQAFDTEFQVAQPIDLPSGPQRVGVTLGRHDAAARLVSRVTPQLDTTAFLVADLPAPSDVWPAGALQLYRDGVYVGEGHLPDARDGRLELPFGRDDQVRVAVDPERDARAAGGFTGGRTERTVQRGYAIENRHTSAVRVEVLESAPVAVDDRVRVTATFAPEPTDRDWNRLPGVRRWVLDLDAGRSTRVGATYVIGAAKDLRVESQ